MGDLDTHTEALGEFTEVGDRWRLRFVRRLAHPPTTVWNAITQPEHLAAWFPTDVEGERVAGAALHFSFRDHDLPGFEGEMLVYDAPHVLEMRWGDDTLRFELAPTGEGTVLTLLDSFDELGKASRDGAGWHVCLDQLAYSLAGAEMPWKPEERWQEVNTAYTQSFGPEASTLGPPQEWIDAHQ